MEILCLKKWLLLKPRSDDLSSLVSDTNSKRNGRPALQFFHLLLIVTYNEGIHPPEKITLLQLAKYRVPERKCDDYFVTQYRFAQNLPPTRSRFTSEQRQALLNTKALLDKWQMLLAVQPRDQCEAGQDGNVMAESKYPTWKGFLEEHPRKILNKTCSPANKYCANSLIRKCSLLPEAVCFTAWYFCQTTVKVVCPSL